MATANELAVPNFMDDAIMTHVIFPVVMRNGQLIQLNQNGAKEETLANAVRAIDRTMYGPLLAAKDFLDVKGFKARRSFLKKRTKKTFTRLVAGYSATAVQKFLLLFSKRSLFLNYVSAAHLARASRGVYRY